MSRRRKNRRYETHGSESPSPPPFSVSPKSPATGSTSVRTEPGSRALPVQALKVEFERVSDMTKTEWSATRKCRPMAYFIYAEDSRDDNRGSAPIKKVALAWKTDFQKELVRKRI